MSSVRPPATIWIVTVLLGAMAFVAIVGAFLFAFALGEPAGYVLGVFLVAFGIGYIALAWRLRRGERRVWKAAVALPIVHTLGLNTFDLVRQGSIPREDLPFMAVALLIVVLLVLPVTRRFFIR